MKYESFNELVADDLKNIKRYQKANPFDLNNDDLSASHGSVRSQISFNRSDFNSDFYFITKRCLKPRDVYLETWKNNDLQAVVIDAINDSRDRRDRINHRIFEET